jgi:hypothetical protein
MSQGLLEVLAEFFEVVESQKAHWYQMFDPGNGDGSFLLIQSTFLSFQKSPYSKIGEWSNCRHLARVPCTTWKASKRMGSMMYQSFESLL